VFSIWPTVWTFTPVFGMTLETMVEGKETDGEKNTGDKVAEKQEDVEL